MKITSEQLAKAKTMKSAEALLAYAGENGFALTEAEAKMFFEQWHREGALSDEELDNIAGGTCYSSGVQGPGGRFDNYVITTPGNTCDYYEEGHAMSSWSAPRTCDNCRHCFMVMNSLTSYCGRRTESNDPMKQ